MIKALSISLGAAFILNSTASEVQRANPIRSAEGSLEWPGWRGPARNGISVESGFDWSEFARNPKVLWRSSVGKGFSSFAVMAGKCYTLGNTNEQDTVYCFDAATGKIIWTHSYASAAQPLSYEGGPSATPVVDDDRVYTLSKWGDCICLEARTGRVIWTRAFEAPPRTKDDYHVWWGFAGSPLVLSNCLILPVGSGAAAVDKLTGSILWHNGPGRPGYSSPVAFRLNSRACFALLSGHEIIGARADTGEVLWKIPWRTTWDQNAADVLVAEDKLFVSTGHGVGCALFDLGAATPGQLWRNKNLKPELSSCVLWNDHVFGFDGRRLACLDWKTGEAKWAAEDTLQGSIILADGKLIVLQENGELLVAEATGGSYQPVAKAQIMTGRCWTLPALANGRLFLRNAAGAVACFELKRSASTGRRPLDQPI